MNSAILLHFDRVYMPTDYDSNICGDGYGEGNDNRFNLSNETFLWSPIWLDPVDSEKNLFIEAFSKGWCVRECPTMMMDVVCHYSYRNLSLEEQVELAHMWSSGENRDPSKGCAFNQFPTESVGQRCIPSLSHTTNQTLGTVIPGLPEVPKFNMFESFFFELLIQVTNLLLDILTEILKSAVPLVIGAFFAAALCFVIIVLFRIVVGPVIYFTLVGILILLIIVTLIPTCLGFYHLMLYFYGSDITSDWFRNLQPESARSVYDFRAMQVCTPNSSSIS